MTSRGLLTKHRLKTIGYRLLLALAWASVGIFFVWSTGAIYHLTLLPRWLSFALAAAYFAGMLGLLWHLRARHRRMRWLSFAAMSIGVIYLVTLIQRPSNDRDWASELTRMPEVVLRDGDVTLRNLRHCAYRTESDFEVRYRDIAFRRNQLKSVWFVVQKFSPLDSVAHTFLSFEIDGDAGPKFFSVSVEIRREADEIYSPIRGLYRQFELIYVIGDERDLLGVRTNVRKTDRVHLYHVNATREQVQVLFDDISDRVNRLRRRPEFYHTLLNNCTNAIVSHTYGLTPDPIRWVDPRIVLPGFSDGYALSRGLIGVPGQSLDELREQSRVDGIAREVGLTDDFSVEIRQRQGS